MHHKCTLGDSILKTELPGLINCQGKSSIMTEPLAANKNKLKNIPKGSST